VPTTSRQRESHLGGSFPHQHAFAAYAKRLETVAVNGGSAGATVARIGRRQRSLQARQTSRLRRSRRLRSLHPRQILKTKHNKTKQNKNKPTPTTAATSIREKERLKERLKERKRTNPIPVKLVIISAAPLFHSS